MNTREDAALAKGIATEILEEVLEQCRGNPALSTLVITDLVLVGLEVLVRMIGIESRQNFLDTLVYALRLKFGEGMKISLN